MNAEAVVVLWVLAGFVLIALVMSVVGAALQARQDAEEANELDAVQAELGRDMAHLGAEEHPT